MAEITIFELLNKQANLHPQSSAIAAPDRSSMNYGELVSQIHYTTNFLCSIGVKRNDRIAIVLPDGPEMAIAFLGVSSCATSAPLNQVYNAKEFDAYLTALGIKYLIVQSGVDSPARMLAIEKGITVVELTPELDKKAGTYTLTSSLTSDDRSKVVLSKSTDVALLLHTSGTTALPKIVPLTHHNICTSVNYFINAFMLDKHDCCLNIMPLFHISGLIGSLLCSLAVGGKSYCCPKFREDSFFLWMKDANPTWYMAAPTMHQALLSRAGENKDIIKANPLRFIRSASSFLPALVQKQLENTFHAPVLVSYGMTETALHISNNPLPPGKTKPGSVGPSSGPDVAIMDDSGKLLSPNCTGEIVVRGENVIRGYEDNPEENRKSFINGWFRTGDQGFLDDDGYLYVTDRIKEIINKGGEKISPAEVDKYLLEHPDILQVISFPIPHPTLEQDIAVAVVLKKDSILTEKAIRELCIKRLAAFKVPNQIVILDEIPKSKTGKYIRKNMFDLLSRRLGIDYVGPRNELENALVDIFSGVLKSKKIGVYDNFFSSGGDSLSALQVLSRIHTQIKLELPISALFRKPTVTELAEVIRATLSAGNSMHVDSICSADKSKPMQLTSEQRSLWFIDSLSEKSSAYNILYAVRLHGELDFDLLQKSFELLVQRHEILRSNYVLHDDEPVITIRENNEIIIDLVDISKYSDKQKRLENELKDEAAYVFDLACSPLLRVKQISMGESDSVLIINIHHIISDGWSMSILRREISIIYNSLLMNEDHTLVEHRIDFFDYAQWKIAQLGTKKINKQLEFWQERLASAPELLELPYKGSRSESVYGNENVQRFSLSENERQSLTGLSEKYQGTLFITLLSVFNILLSTYAGRKDIIVGVPVAGRNNEEVEGLIGLFVNTIVLRADLTDITDFNCLLSHVKDILLEALSNQDVSFEKVVDHLNPVRHIGINPIYQVMFSLQNTPKSYFDLQDITTTPVNISNTASKMDLSLDVTDDNQNLEFALSYNTDLFEDVMISSMLEHYKSMLHEIINESSHNIADIVSSTLPKRETILYDWNKTQKNLHIENTFNREFERQVEETPDYIATVFYEKKLTYSQLNAKANQLANYLLSVGVRPKQPVVLCLDRSIDSVVAVLSILKAGCYYVPMDPDYPESRLGFILDDVKAGFIITQSSYKKIFHGADLVVVCVDEIPGQLNMEDTKNLQIGVQPDDLIYIIYTSGTTGNPKGVMIEHRSVLNLAFSYKDKLFKKINKKNLRVSLNAPLVFDASVQQLNMLLYGYTLYMIPDEVRHDIDDFVDFICTNRLNVLDYVPSQFQLMLDGGLLDKWKNEISIVLLGGEAISEKMWQQLVSNKEIIFYNTYGPTECTVDSSRYHINGSTHGPVIGRPIDNYKLFILDNDCNLVPIGVAGELHVGGIGVARGYLNRPQLTDEKFIRSPFLAGENDRLYKTGDLVRYLDDGNIEYLGRIDHQVKIRGYRIELGEIESNLEDHPDVKQALVNVYENDVDNKLLVAYIVRSGEGYGSNPDYSGFLKEKIPDYMVPVTYVHIDKIPLTTNGKIDKKLLPKPDFLFKDMEKYRQAETETEKELVGIWEEILGISGIGVLDNFFSLGGHSLIATRLLSRIKNKTGIKLTLKNLFLAPVIKDLATVLDREKKSYTVSDDRLVDEVKNDYPLSSAQKRLWFVSQLYPDNNSYNLPLIWKLSGALDIAALDMAINNLVRKHSILRTVFIENESAEPRQYVKEFSKSFVKIVMSESNTITNKNVNDLVEQDVCVPFDMENGPLIRFSVYKVDENEYVFALCMHHIISDAWSLNLLFDELVKSYNEIHQTGVSNIDPLPYQYSAYSLRQQQLLANGEWAQQLQYWEEKLSGSTPLDIAGQIHTHKQLNETTSEKCLVLKEDIISGIRNISELNDVSMFVVFLSIFNLLAHKLSGQDDFTIGAPVAIRDSEELEKLIGLFLNNVILRFDMSGDPSFEEVIRRVKAVILEVFENLDVPYDQVVERLMPGQSLETNPFFNVLFNYISEADQNLDFNEIESHKLKQPKLGARFDITFYLEVFSDYVMVKVNYSTSRYSDSEIENIIQSYEFLIRQIIDKWDAKISDYSLVTEKAEKLLPDSNEHLETAKLETVLSSFDSVVDVYPDNIAVATSDANWSYRDLKQRSNYISLALMDKGLKPGNVVAIIGVKGFSVIASMIGVLRSGGVALTIDQNLPEARIALMVDEANARYIIAKDVANKQNCLNDLKYIYVTDNDADLSLSEGVDNISLLTPDIHLDSPAYIFFTSGSTGKPKAILGSHKGLAHCIKWQGDTFNITSEDRVSQLTSLTFDVILRDIFLPVTRGACICIPQEDDYEVLAWIEKNGLTAIHTVPSLVSSWLQVSVQKLDFSRLRYIFFSGEPLNGALIKKIKQCCNGKFKIINMYGPTETTMVKSWYEVPEDYLTGTQPIGVPLPNSQLLILGKWKQICGINEPGEIAIRTPYRTLGYLEDGNNQGKFINNPFNDDENDVIYLTGDQGKIRSDGIYEYLGRIDDQIKINGVRIELAEISAVISSYNSVNSSYVNSVKREGMETLVAYIVSEPGQKFITEDLKKYLRLHLPEVMVPKAFITIDRFPLLPSGKIDRKKLPGPVFKKPSLEGHVEPRTNLQKDLAEIWSDLLGAKRIGIKDNFFDLGGHSLLAVQLMSRISRKVNFRVPLKYIFLSPQIDLLSVVIEDLLIKNNNYENVVIKKQPRGKDFPLTYPQSTLWLHDALTGGSSVYNIPLAFKLTGILNIDALKRSFSEIINRHDSLRTSFQNKDGDPVQVISQSVAPDFSYEDISLQTADQSELLDNFISDNIRYVFDLKKPPLLKINLLKYKKDHYVFFVNAHHIIFDGWSWGILLNELECIYNAISSNRKYNLYEPAIHLVDFAVWQRQKVKSPEMSRQIEYWKEKLKNLPDKLSLPVKKEQIDSDINTGSCEKILFPKEIIDSLDSVCSTEKVTLFMLFLSAYYVLLRRFSNQEDIIIGTPLSGRNTMELENLIGFFINVLAIRVSPEGDLSYRELLYKVKGVVLDAFEYQDLPIEEVNKIIKIAGQGKYKSPFQAMFVFQNFPQSMLALDNIEANVIDIKKTTSKVDFSMVINRKSKGLEVSIEYNSALYEKSIIQSMLKSFKVLLGGVNEKLNEKITEISLLSNEDMNRTIVEWNDTYANYPLDQGIHILFQQQVDKTPNNVAIRFEDQELTYRELDDKSSKLANYLIDIGVQSEDLVALCMDPSVEMIISLLGIIKSGGAYLPIDPIYPDVRKQYLMSDSGCKYLVTRNHLLEDIPLTSSIVINFDEKWHEAEKMNASLPKVKIESTSLAYVIYTSGSTGNPKGVLIEHKGLCNLALAQIKAFGVSSESRILQVASFSFDASVSEVFMALLSGATLVMAPKAKLYPGPELIKLLNDQKITTITLTPSALARLAEDKIIYLQDLVVAGEAGSRDLLTKWAAKLNLHNAYGPTEGTVCATIASRISGHEATNIGKPLENATIYILDTHLQPVPVGVHGELHIGGAGLARGYLNRPELSREKFIPNPFSTEIGSRLYKTGDMACFKENGNIEFIGRIDHQVKIRGYRIELGEIESVMLQHVAINQVIVTDLVDNTGDKKLIAYYISENRDQNIINDLRKYMKDRLPDYMVPSTFVEIEKIPLTPNGKLDKAALPMPDKKAGSKEGTAPRNETEKRLAKIWMELLSVNNVSIEDDFFDLGGHSLLGVDLVTKITKIFNKELPLTSILENSKLYELAEILSQEHEVKSSKTIVPLKVTGNRAPFFCIHGRANEIVKYIHEDQPFYWLHHSAGSVKAEYMSVEDIASKHIDEIKTVQPVGPYYLGGFSFGGLVAFEVAQQLTTRGEEVAFLALFDSTRPKNIKAKENKLGSVIDDLNIKETSIEKIQHLCKKLFNVLSGRIRYLTRIIKQFVQLRIYSIYASLGLNIPSSLRVLKLLEYFGRASNIYVYKEYQKEIILFMPEGTNTEHKIDELALAWEGVAVGGVEINIVDGAVTHHQIVEEPYVQDLVGKLNISIEKHMLRKATK